MTIEMLDPRNISDCFKGKPDEEIVAELDDSRSPLIVMTENVNGDFHKANILRTAEAFNITAFHIVGKRKWDKRGAVGAYNRMAPVLSETFAEAFAKIPDIDDYRIVAIDNTPGSVSLATYHWHPKTIMIFGEEGAGTSESARSIADTTVYIPMRGAVRSFSVSTAAGIVMYDYTNAMSTLRVI